MPHAGAAHGGGEYLNALLGALATRVDLGLVTFVTPAEQRRGDSFAAPLAYSDAVLLRRREDLPGVRRMGAQSRWLRRWLRGRPLTIAKFESAAMRNALTRAVATFDPHACLIEFDLMAQYLDVLRDRVTILTDHEAGDPVPAKIGPAGLGMQRDRRLWRRYVDETYPLATAVQALNRHDAEALSKRLGRPVGIRPATTELPERVVCPGAVPPRALFMGDYSHHPNPEAVRFVAREVWPIVRAECPAAELWVAGPRMPAALGHELAAIDGVVLQGFVEDRDGLLESTRLLLAPVFSGSGSRIKVLTALAAGLPVVTNRRGARGIDAPEAAMRVAEGAPAMAAASLDWLLRPANAEAAGRDAREWADLEISPAAVADRQVAEIRALLARQ